jgi:hypothetical protein
MGKKEFIAAGRQGKAIKTFGISSAALSAAAKPDVDIIDGQAGAVLYITLYHCLLR